MNSTVGVRSFWVGLWGLCSLGAMACTPRSVPPSGPPTTQSSDGAQTVARLLQHMQTLASDDFGGRAPGTAGEQRTVHYIVDALRALGLRGGAADGSFTQPVPLIGITGRPQLRLDLSDSAGKSGSAATFALRFPDDYVAMSRRLTDRVQVRDAQIIFVGHGVIAPEYGWDDYKGLDVRGKTLLMLSNDPQVEQAPGRPDPQRFRGDAMTYYGRWTYKYEIASRLGAAAVFIVHETALAGYPYAVVRAWDREQIDIDTGDGNDARVAVEGWLSEGTARALLSACGQDLTQLKKAAARPDFVPRPLPVRAQVQIENTLRRFASHNIVARIDGTTTVNAETFNQNSWDNCCLDHFEVRRMNGDCNGQPDDFGPTVDFCCSDIGDTVQVIFRVYDCYGNYNECMVQAFVEDKIKPTCEAPANVTVNCEAFDPSLWAYGTATALDNCCVDTITTAVNYNLFDTVCNRGTITRTFRSFDCAGNSSQCTQRIIVTYEQDYFVKFPNDVIITNCDGTGNYGQPEFFGKDCELMGVSFQDEIFTVVPDACMKIERTWTIINWCTYDVNKSCVYVPNPNPNATVNHPSNLTGPIVSAFGTPAPWAPTVISIAPGEPQTNYSQFWNANANCYQYKQIIKIVDTKDPIVSNCPDSLVQYCDLSVNDNQLWSQPYWWDGGTELHDLCEGDAPLSITATDSCSGSYLNASFLLFLDTDGNGSMETVVSSNNPPTPGTVDFNNANTPNFKGGTPQVFDGRSVPASDIYRWAVHQANTGSVQTISVQWKTLAQMPTPANPLGQPGIAPQLPHGKHKIKWTISDGCGNEATCEYEFEVKDCKAPTIVCNNGLSVNIMPTDMVQMWAIDFLKYAEDNCTPPTPNHANPNKLVFGVRKAGSGNGFPLDANGDPITSVTFDCSELGTQNVELWSVDLAGNADFCVATIDVQDNSGFCGSDNLTIAGALKTEMDEGVEDANVNLQGTLPGGTTTSTFDMTDDQGAYLFPSVLPPASNYTLTPTKDDNPLNGVSTYDLVLITRHILGLEPLNSPYKMIAADANKSNSITTFDVVEIRKLILGIYNDFPANTSWRFVDAAYDFPVPDNPWSTQFPETKSVVDVQTHQLNDDFVGVKIGDVNNTVIANSLITTDDRSGGTLLFDVDDRRVKAGETFTVTFKAAEKVRGYQFTMTFDGLKVVDVVPGNHMSAGNFGIFERALTTSMDVPPSAAGETMTFSVTFRAEKAGKLSEMLGVSSRITRAEAYQERNDGNYSNYLNLLDVALRFNNGKTSAVSGVGFELYQNQPNPFVNRTAITFHLPEAAEATVTVRDETGRLMWTQKGDYAKGYNTVTLDRALLNTTGVLYYTVETAQHAATKMMIQSK